MKVKQITIKFHHVIFFTSLLLTVAVIFKLFNWMNVGVDLTDEGYYFNWISNPWLYKYYASQFGYIYHPIYKALGNSIVHLRQANMLISYGLSWLLSYFVLRECLRDMPKLSLVIASAGLALPAIYILMITGYWVPSPSYNSLNFQGCLIAALGFFVSESLQLKHKQATAGLLIGVGGWLVFMAKPSTALLLAVVALLFYLPSIKKDNRILIIAGITSALLLVLSALCIDGSVLQFIKRFQGGLLLMATMDSGHGLSSLFKLDLLKVDETSKVLYAWLAIMIVLAFFAQSIKHVAIKAALNALLLILLLVVLYQWVDWASHLHTTPMYHILAITTLLLSAFFYSLFISKQSQDENSPPLKLTLLFLVLPYLYAAGTGNNYWLTAAGATVFWVLTATLLLANKQVLAKQLHVVLAVVVILSAYGIFNALNAPYRQSVAIFKQTATFVDPHSKQTLVLAQDTAKYLNTLTQALSKAGFKPQTPVIDLTGHHPGALYFMQAKAIGQAWTIGGYKGSVPLATMALYHASCHEVASAWLLIEKEGRRQIPHTILEEHGIKADKTTYQKLAKFNSQQLFKTHQKKVFEHYLLKPVDVENQTEACLAYRKTHPSPFE
jgi:hypothetical protein